MGILVLFRFSIGSRGVVALEYDQLGHGSEGQWSTICPLIGLVDRGVPFRGADGHTCSLGRFKIVGGVVTMEELDVKGAPASVAELRDFPKLGGMSELEIKARKFEGPFRLFRGSNHLGDPTGTWHCLGLGGKFLD